MAVDLERNYSILINPVDEFVGARVFSSGGEGDEVGAARVCFHGWAGQGVDQDAAAGRLHREHRSSALVGSELVFPAP